MLLVLLLVLVCCMLQCAPHMLQCAPHRRGSQGSARHVWAGREIIGMYNELHTTEEDKQAALDAEKAASQVEAARVLLPSLFLCPWLLSCLVCDGARARGGGAERVKRKKEGEAVRGQACAAVVAGGGMCGFGCSSARYQF